VPHYPKIAQFKTVAAFRDRLAELALGLPVDERPLSAAEGSPLAEPIELTDGRNHVRAGNRWCIHPMEGWDANRNGTPSDLTLRRWRHFGLSGAKFIWGGEAAAVQEDGRANPNQTLATEHNQRGLSELLLALQQAHHEAFGSLEGLIVGLQLTHSGRFCKPNDHKRFEPRIAYHHPLLDARVGIQADDDSRLWTDDDLEKLIDRYVAAAKIAREAGFQFVDIKACHGYLLHEFLSARTRPGRFGGDFAGRTRILTTIIARIRGEIPHLLVGVRLSAFDTLPYQPGGEDGTGVPAEYHHLLPYTYGFGASEADPTQVDLAEPIRLLKLLKDLGVFAVNLSGGSPYYNPHVQRPAIFPPSDGYQPPEDPLVGVARQIHIARQLKEAAPGLATVGTAYSYLQDYLPHVAQGIVRQGWADFVGLGRVVLSYPELPADVLAGHDWQRKKVCRTFSDCTTAPRNGFPSGCYPLDPFYKERPEAERLKDVKERA
jgi:NADPH2 dehydrogenase